MTVDLSTVSLAGKVAVVTGAARGIGRATALALANFGADLAVCDRRQDDLEAVAAELAATGRRVVSEVMDVRHSASVERFVTRTAAEYGPIDVLVNNAGGTFWSPFTEIRRKGRDAMVAENFMSVVDFIHTSLPHMPDGASIINVTSIEAWRAAPGFSIYAAMKAAVEQLTRTLALELSHRRIRVNTIAPDAIPTPGDQDLGASLGLDVGAYGARIPLGLGSPDDCAGPIVFLASDLSRFMTGTTLHIDGGTLAAAGWARQPDGTFHP
jgi:3-oxoacyl-[acyl-carrier protein] reductase